MKFFSWTLLIGLLAVETLFFCSDARAQHSSSGQVERRIRFPIEFKKSDVLMIADSHSAGCFGAEIYEGLRADLGLLKGAPPTLVAVCGSQTKSWLSKEGARTKCGYRVCVAGADCQSNRKGRAPELTSLLAKTNPKIVVVELGTNMLPEYEAGSWEKTSKEIDELLSKIRSKGSSCIWIGPPQAPITFIPVEKYNNFVRDLETKVTGLGCRFIGSQKATARENIKVEDGVHYSCPFGRAWGENISPRLNLMIEKTLTPKKSPAIQRVSPPIFHDSPTAH